MSFDEKELSIQRTRNGMNLTFAENLIEVLKVSVTKEEISKESAQKLYNSIANKMGWVSFNF
jgi:hypothetical protein